MARIYLGRFAALLLFASTCVACCAPHRVAQIPPELPLQPPGPIPDLRPRVCFVPDVKASQDIVLDVPRVSQSIPYAEDGDSDVCWAATLNMVLGYYGSTLPLCKIMALRPDIIPSCCRAAESMDKESAEICNQGADVVEIARAMNRIGLYFTYDEGRISEATLIDELAHGRPVYISRKNGVHYTVNEEEVDQRHATLITGHVGGKFRVIDPSPWDTKPTDVSFDQLVNGYGTMGEWKGTWYKLSFRADRCNPLFVPGCSCDRR